VLNIRISLLALLFCSGAACSSKETPAGKGGNPPAEHAISLALFGDLDVTQMDKDQLLTEIRQAKGASGNDDAQRAFLQQFESQVSTWADPSKDGEVQKRASSLLPLLRQLISTGPRNIETQLQAASRLLELSYTMQNLDMNYRPIREEAIQATRSLVRTFPKEDRAYAQLGHVLITSDEAEAPNARAQFEMCLDLNSTNTYCRNYLARLASP